MKKFQRWIMKVMRGRYGSDQLSLALLIGSLIFSLLGSFTKVFLFGLLANVLLIISLIRFFSKNIQKRYAENQRFMVYVRKIQNKFKNVQKKFKERKTHKYIKCPNCKRELRLPRNKGRIRVTCPICKEQFERKT